ncbi:MAG TPA: ribosome recycling factor [Elusimicrobiota bacterium]|nr:ribosome recycling factor [Elusimicrobiota bacterium]
MGIPNVPQLQPVLAQMEDKMKKAVEKMRQDFSTLRTGRATGALLDNLKVLYYGSQVPLKQVAAVGVPDGRTIEIKPWDVSALPEIEKAIQASDLGLTPNNDGKIIRLSVPSLTEERRRDLVKAVKKMAEDFRVSIRNDRREAMEKLKKFEKDKVLSEDQRKLAEEGLQKTTDLYIKQIDESLAVKEKEIMEV